MVYHGNNGTVSLYTYCGTGNGKICILTSVNCNYTVIYDYLVAAHSGLDVVHGDAAGADYGASVFKNRKIIAAIGGVVLDAVHDESSDWLAGGHIIKIGVYYSDYLIAVSQPVEFLLGGIGLVHDILHFPLAAVIVGIARHYKGCFLGGGYFAEIVYVLLVSQLVV